MNAGTSSQMYGRNLQDLLRRVDIATLKHGETKALGKAVVESQIKSRASLLVAELIATIEINS